MFGGAEGAAGPQAAPEAAGGSSQVWGGAAAVGAGLRGVCCGHRAFRSLSSKAITLRFCTVLCISLTVTRPILSLPQLRVCLCAGSERTCHSSVGGWVSWKKACPC